MNSREAELFNSFHLTSSNVLELQGLGVKFPKDVRGMKILDVGAASSIVGQELQERGATVFSLDYCYKDTEEFKQRSNAVLDALKPANSKLPKRDADRVYNNERNMQRVFFKTYSLRGNFVAGDARALPFADNLFDFVLASKSIDYLTIVGNKEYKKALSELLRVVNPGGQAQMLSLSSNKERALQVMIGAREVVASNPGVKMDINLTPISRVYTFNKTV